jgi:hypothetical protein
MEKDCISIYQSHIQILKEIDTIKYGFLNQSPSKTSATDYDKNKNLNSSIISDAEESPLDSSVLKKNLE